MIVMASKMVVSRSASGKAKGQRSETSERLPGLEDGHAVWLNERQGLNGEPGSARRRMGRRRRGADAGLGDCGSLYGLY